MSQKKSVSIIPGQFPQTVYLSQGDVGREFVLELVDENGAYAVPAEATVKFAGTKPSGLGFTADVVMSSTTGGTRCIATITSTYDMTSEYGRFPAEVKITQGDDILGTANVYLDIEKNPHPEGTTDGSMDTLIPELTVLVERVEAAAVSAAANSLKAEGFAVGQQDGEDVDNTSPYYHNNAKYYKEQAATAAGNAATAETNAENSEQAAAGYKNDALGYKNAAKNSADDAEAAAAAAAGSAAAAAAVFTVAGDMSASIDADGDLWLNITVN